MKKIYISGNARKEIKEQIKKKFELSLINHKKFLSKKDKDFFEKYEIKKTKKEIEIIKELNRISNNIIKKVGGNIYDILPDNIHFLSEKGYFELKKSKKKSDNSDGFVDYNRQMIIIRKEYFKNKSLIYFISVLFHEILHLKGILEIRVDRIGKNENIQYLLRTGISILFPYNYKNVNSKTYERFWGLHEAIITYQEKISFSDLLNLPQLKKEKEWLESEEYQKLKEKKSEETKCPIDEIIYIDKKDYKNWNYYQDYWLRQLLKYILEEIQKEFPQYKNKEEVFKEFLKAQYKRNHIEKVRELFDKTFGKYAFLTLGNIQSGEVSEIYLHFGTFEKLREGLLKEKKK
jgi:hypothetical protein